jgi:hypothetical protein
LEESLLAGTVRRAVLTQGLAGKGMATGKMVGCLASGKVVIRLRLSEI